jgi:hypothetical protein
VVESPAPKVILRESTAVPLQPAGDRDASR